jgi:tetratricopeptide (TPR) repeat protein
MCRKWIRRWVLLCGVGTLPLAQAATVAIMDFETPAEDSTLAWARLGVPDLLMVEMADQGWGVLDRESIAQVMKDYSLAGDMKAGHLVGAEYVVSGKVSIPEPGRLMMEGVLSKVEGLVPVRSVVQTGAYPKEMSEIVQALAKDLAAAVPIQSALPPDRAETSVLKPEALIFFYQGLSAYSSGHPEVAAAWFISANRMDPHFVAAMAWEIRALESAGFMDMAERSRSEHGRQWTELQKTEGAGVRTLALACPLLTPVQAWLPEQTREILSALSVELSRHKDVSLVNPEAMERAIREQDHQLSGFFARAGTSRYGRWRIPDGILQCRIERDGDIAQIRLGIDTLSTGGSQVVEEARVPLVELSESLSRLLQRILARWETEMTSDAGREVQTVAASLPAESMRDMSEQYRSLPPALHRLRQADGYVEWKAVADAFGQIGYFALEGLAVDRAIEAIPLDDPDGDLMMYRVWYELYWEWPWPSKTLRYTTPALITGLEMHLLNRFPDSICTGAIWYKKGRMAWEAQRLEEAADCMEKALKPLRAADQTDIGLGMIVSALYIQADSLGRLGSTAEALRLFREAQQQVQQHPEGILFHLDQVVLHDDRQWYFRNGVPRVDLTSLLEKEIRQHELAEGVHSTLGERLDSYYQQYKSGSLRIEPALREFIVPALNTLIEAWKMDESIRLAGDSDMNLAYNWLNLMAQVVSVEERREWFPAFLEAYLHRVGVESAGTFAQTEPLALLPHVRMLWRLFDKVGLRPEGLEFIDRFISADVSTDIAMQVLVQIELEREELGPRLVKLAERMPDGERGILGALWMQLALRHARGQDWANAEAAMSKGLASSQPASPGAETASILIRRVMARPSEDPHAAVQAECAALGLLPWIPRWGQWYNQGVWAAAEGQDDMAIACFQVVLRYLAAPQKMDPTLSIEPATATCVAHLRQGRDMDLAWFSAMISRRNSAKFRLALSYLGVHRLDQAAALLREVALEVGQDRVGLIHQALPDSSYGVHLGVLASTMLHSLHLLNEIHGTEMPELERTDVIKRSESAGRELLSRNLNREAQYFFSAAERLKSTP